MAADGSLIFDTRINTDGVSEGINSIEKGFGSIVSTAAKISGAVTTAFTAASAAAVKVGMDFQASMSQVAATMGITADTQAFETLETAAKEMGESTQFSASQAAEALNYLALAGYNAEKAVSALPTVLNVAAAGGMELASASDMITDAMSALGLSADEMTVFADRLAVTAQKSNTSVSQLGEAILTVGGTAKSLTGGVVEMNTALGILADNGIKGSEGGTALRNVILSLSAPTDTAAAALERLNVKAFDMSGNMRPLEDTFADLNTALSSLSDQARTAVLNEIFNKVDLKSVNALLGTSAERFRELSGYISDCEGAAADMAETMNDNLKGDLTVMGSVLEAAGNAAFEKFEQPLRTAVQGATKSIGDLTESLTDGELSGAFESAAGGMSKLAEETLKLVAEDVLPAAVKGFAWAADNFDTIVTVAGAAAAGIAAYTAAAKGAAAATTALSAAAALNPLGLVAAGAAAATAAVVAFTNAANERLSKRNQLDETTQAIYEQISAYKELTETAEENSQKAEQTAASAKHYWYEVQKLADEQGNAKGSAEELNTAVARLNEAAGTNIEVINGQIQGYKELALTMDDYIERTKREAQMSYLKDSYGEALMNIDETNENYNRALEEKLSAYEDYNSKLSELRRAERTGYSENTPYEQLLLDTDEAEKRFSAAATQVAALEQQLNSYQSVIDKYEDLASYDGKSGGGEYKSTAQLDAEEQAKKLEETAKKNAETLAKQQETATTALSDGWKRLEHDYAVGTIATETELYEKKKALWNEYGDASLTDHWSYIEDISKYDREFAEEQIKLAQKEADEKRRIQEEKNKKAEEERQNSIDEQKEIVSDGLSDILKSYREAYDELDQKRKNYRDKLMSIGGDLFSVDEIENPDGSKTKQYTVNNVDEQLRRMREYNSAVKKLRAEGMSDGLLSELTSLNGEDSAQFAKYLAGMSASEFAKINELYSEKQKLADELADDLYKDDAQLISDSMTAALGDLAVSAYSCGAQAAEEFSKGFSEAANNLGLNSLYSQLRAAGSAKSYENYVTVNQSVPDVNVTVTPGKTSIYLDGKKLGEANTVYESQQSKITGR
ncbi:MAG: phage tail tape measure protein [Prevotella sp.]|nr:phage tail tape measure protein [Prevotella sp.]